VPLVCHLNTLHLSIPEETKDSNEHYWYPVWCPKGAWGCWRLSLYPASQVKNNEVGKINLVESKENYIYLGLIRITIWENTDSNILENGLTDFTKWWLYL
jgi:hypothetical protein